MNRNLVFEPNTPIKILEKDIIRRTLHGEMNPDHELNTANIVESQIKKLNSRECDFRSVDTKNSDIEASNFDTCDFSAGGFIWDQFNEVTFINCNFNSTIIQDCNFNKTSFINCNFDKMLFRSCRFTDCIFDKCKIMNPLFEYSLFINSKIKGMDIPARSIMQNMGLNKNSFEGKIDSDKLLGDFKELYHSISFSNSERKILDIQWELFEIGDIKQLRKQTLEDLFSFRTWHDTINTPFGSFTFELFFNLLEHSLKNNKLPYHTITKLFSLVHNISKSTKSIKSKQTLLVVTEKLNDYLDTFHYHFLQLATKDNLELNLKLHKNTNSIEIKKLLDRLNPKWISDNTINISFEEKNATESFVQTLSVFLCLTFDSNKKYRNAILDSTTEPGKITDIIDWVHDRKSRRSVIEFNPKDFWLDPSIKEFEEYTLHESFKLQEVLNLIDVL
ncbi:MAG TPA: hypothetical protein DCE41_28245 [Cytophagales bacterium]|nr:hypothetical protein [Cytophagales bacterium]HAA23507.1 hypothetical protein [Cytophagales bacterium]HAP61158.1 hypothetical protein [Cytophagales bacterium]